MEKTTSAWRPSNKTLVGIILLVPLACFFLRPMCQKKQAEAEVTSDISLIDGIFTKKVVLPADFTDDCVPTSGECASSVEDLQTALTTASPSSVVALCPGHYKMQSGLHLEDPRVLKLCCLTAFEEKCQLEMEGQDKILDVRGFGDFAVQGIHFVNGFGGGTDVNDDDEPAIVSNDGPGGNLYVNLLMGGVVIHNCRFNGGENRGNVFIASLERVLLLDSHFSCGYPGGVVVDKAMDVVVSNCDFAHSEQTGLFVTRIEDYEDSNDPKPKPTLDILDSSFTNNSGDDGGGFFASYFGSFPTLTVLSTEFKDNKAKNEYSGGAGSATYLDKAFLYGNTGGNNHQAGEGDYYCTDFAIDLSAGDDDDESGHPFRCLGINETFSMSAN